MGKEIKGDKAPINKSSIQAQILCFPLPLPRSQLKAELERSIKLWKKINVKKTHHLFLKILKVFGSCGQLCNLSLFLCELIPPSIISGVSGSGVLFQRWLVISFD